MASSNSNGPSGNRKAANDGRRVQDTHEVAISPEDNPAPLINLSASQADNLRQAEILLELRAARGTVFPEWLFGEPGWEILLVLYSKELRQERVVVSDIQNIVRAPATTSLRWIGSLVKRGYIEEHPDPLDGRRKFLELTGLAMAQLNQFMKIVRESTEF